MYIQVVDHKHIISHVIMLCNERVQQCVIPTTEQSQLVKLSTIVNNFNLSVAQ